jgi:hypothetical protein
VSGALPSNSIHNLMAWYLCSEATLSLTLLYENYGWYFSYYFVNTINFIMEVLLKKMTAAWLGKKFHNFNET